MNFLRGVTRGYADEIAAHKEKLRKQKELEDLEERKKFVDVGALEKEEREKENEKKKDIIKRSIKSVRISQPEKSL